MSRAPANKHELGRQRDALARYQRYLPTLRLKQRQLQAELRRAEVEVREASDDEERLRRDLSAWIELWSEPLDLGAHLALQEVRRGETSVAGVTLPTLEAVRWTLRPPSPTDTPPWVDDAVATFAHLAELRLRRAVLAERRRRLADELRHTRQRVNLFEKVKIPEAQEALRRIRIALGDRRTAAVVRAKIAKAKGVERKAPA